MKIHMTMHEALNIKGNERERISQICKGTGLAKFQVRSILKNSVKSLNMETISTIFSYLVEKGEYTKPEVSELLGSMFGIVPDKIWSMISSRRRIELCIGARRDRNWNDRVVTAADSMLQASFLHCLSEPKTESENVGKSTPSVTGYIIDPHLVESWDKGKRASVTHQDIARSATEFYDRFEGQPTSKALVNIGSVKSNPVSECAIANCFKGATPFEPEDEVDNPSLRSCPFMICYREDDPNPPSCHAGLQLAKNRSDGQPGIYYALDEDEWGHLPWNDNEDCALICYRFEKSTERLDMVLGGYSGRGTRCLSERISRVGADEFWPPVFTGNDEEIGVFLLRFTFDKAVPETDLWSYREPGGIEIIPLSEAVVQSRAGSFSK